MTITRIGFTGTRKGLREDQKEQIKSILNTIKDLNNIIVLHWDCIGSDTDFHNLCKDLSLDIKIHIYPPNNSYARGFNKGDLLIKKNHI